MITIDLARAEVEELHVSFVDWIGGACTNDDATFERRIISRLDPGLTYVMPGGTSLTRRGLRNALRGAHGSNPDFRIQIRDVQLRHAFGEHAVVTYREWQRNAKSSKPENNGRVSSVLFRETGSGLVWAHIHETWLPPDVIAAGPYDF